VSELREIPGWEDYKISEAGDVFSGHKGTFLTHATTTKGYKKVSLSRHGLMTQIEIHRLVAVAFIGPIPPGYQVNHKDGDKNNNHVSNLEIVTARENTAHAIKMGFRKDLSVTQRGENNPTAKLCDDAVRSIRAAAVSKRGDIARLAEKFGVSGTLILAVRNRKIWTHI
jgi:hypothetical protein